MESSVKITSMHLSSFNNNNNNKKRPSIHVKTELLFLVMTTQSTKEEAVSALTKPRSPEMGRSVANYIHISLLLVCDALKERVASPSLLTSMDLQLPNKVKTKAYVCN